MLKFTEYAPRIMVGKDDGNNVLAVRVLNTDGTTMYTQQFEDSRHADLALHDALEAVR